MLTREIEPRSEHILSATPLHTHAPAELDSIAQQALPTDTDVGSEAEIDRAIANSDSDVRVSSLLSTANQI